MDKHNSKLIKLDSFAANSANAKSPIQLLIAHIGREVNRQKLSYDQLRYVFKTVRDRYDVTVPTKPKKLYELPTAEEMALFYGAIKSPVHKLIFEVLENTGLRVAELCNLEVGRINFAKNLVFVSEGKGKKDRVTVIGNRALEKISIYLEDRNNRYLFESRHHTKYSTRRIQQLCQEYRKDAGITVDLTPHTVRHLWNTKLAEAGLSEERRALLAGHADGSNTQKIYTHLSAGGFKDEVIEILDNHS